MSEKSQINLIGNVSAPLDQLKFGVNITPDAVTPGNNHLFSHIMTGQPISPSLSLGGNAPQQLALQQEINTLKQEMQKSQQELKAKDQDVKVQKQKLADLAEQYRALQEKERLSHLIDAVNDQCGRKLLESEAFRAQFTQLAPLQAYVMSVDIRRSTELMLKAREPKLFADFITELCVKLQDAIKANLGVFDKFTGDGVLAFFPKFCSGEDAGYLAIKTASECHQIFNEHYQHKRSCFTSVLKGTGLGIGIDLGATHLVSALGGLTVVGTPVVYACRLSGAQPGETLLNQPAFEEVFERYSAYCSVEETEIEIKHEGPSVAYRVKLNGKPFNASAPAWLANDAKAPAKPATAPAAKQAGS